jgi:RND family efflux transporter MFP subunit
MSLETPRLDDLRIERKPVRRPRRGGGWLLAVVVVVIALAGFFWWRAEAATVEVHTTTVHETSSGGPERAVVLNASGYVTARRQATVSSKVTGKVVEVLIEEGMKVKEGQVLARLDDTNVRNNLDVAQAQLESAEVTMDETRALIKQATNEFNRVEALAKQNIDTQEDLDRAESDALSLRARLARQQRDVTVAERQVALWQQQMDDAIIRAPFDGVITTKDAQPGEMISPVSAGGGFTRTGIGTVVDMTSLEIEVDVNESYINKVEAGQLVSATLDAYQDWQIPCKVIAIIPTADRQKSTVKVRIGFDKLDPRILPEMSVKVAFQESAAAASKPTRTLTVPKNAIVSQDGKDILFVVENNHAVRREVTITSAQNDDDVVGSGAYSGEKVILDPPADLKDGAAVREKNI